MTLDEAIKEFTDWAKGDRKEQNFWAAERDENDETNPLSYANCEGLARDAETRAEYHEQLAEWLTELKEWRRVYGICPSYEMCIPECREGYNAQIAEYKRLLKAAVEDMYNSVNDVHCKYCSKWHTDQCQGTSHLDCYIENKFKWRYADEALKLIES